MSALVISLAACIAMLGGAAAGVLFRRRLPQHHLNEHSKDIVRLGAALLATISALVLGLLITSAKNTYETQRDEVRQIAAKLILLDSLLTRYGPEAHAARDLQRQVMALMVARIWGDAEVKLSKATPYKPFMEGESVIVAIESLSPQTEVQRNIKLRALQTTTAIVEMRVLLFEQAEGGLPVPLLVVLIFWLVILFASFTLFSPVNPTNAVVLAVLALSAASAIFLILELSDPFGGLMRIPSAPLHNALGAL